MGERGTPEECVKMAAGGGGESFNMDTSSKWSLEEKER